MLREGESYSALSIASSQYSRERDYWLDKLSGELIKSSFPYDFLGKKDFSELQSEVMEFTFSSPLTGRLMGLSKGSDYTLFMVLSAVLVVLLGRYSGNEDIIIGMPIYKQDTEDDFINTVLVLRSQVHHHMTFKELLLQVRQTIIDAEEHQNYALETLLYQLNLPFSQDNFPLFDIAVLLENIQDKKYIQHIHLNMIFSFKRLEDSIAAAVEYNSFRYRKETVEQVVRHYTLLLETLVGDVNSVIAFANLLSKEEMEQLLFDFNNTAVEYPRDKNIVQLFEEQVEKKPDTIAVSASSFVSYRHLNNQSNQLACLLMERGVKPDTVVGLMVERSADMIPGIIGILKAGGAYLPIEPDCPAGRVRYMLADSGAKVLLTNLPEGHHFNCQLSIVNYQLLMSYQKVPFHHSSNQFIIHHSSNLAYIIYTSGSTGRPKGVMICHRNLHNLVTGLKERIYKKYLQPLKVALVSPYSFDASVKQIFAALLLGHTLHIVPEDTRVDGYRLLEYFKNHAVDVIDGTPTHIKLLLETGMKGSHFLCLKHLLIGGEALPRATAAEFFGYFPEKPTIIANVYGPTECSVDTTAYEVTQENIGLFETVPIGKPMPNTGVHILSPRGKLQPVGVGGELCIIGDGVGLGYLNNPELTADKFYWSYMSYRTYKTGDLARWLPDGNIEFLGRKDTQVKIRGYRIELEEIEHCMLKYPPIKDVVVLPRGDGIDDKYLCTYFTTRKPDPLETAKIREYLSGELHDYMIPSRFLQLEEIPFTPNGKVDRRALPEPGTADTGSVYTAPRDSLEEKLVEIWSRVLKINNEEIGIDTNFFDIGGHSLRATILVSAVHKEFDTWIPLQEIFKTPTVRGIAAYIKNSGKDTFIAVEPVEEREYYHLSSAQKRLYVSQQMDVNSTGYTMAGPVLLEGQPDLDKMEAVFRMLIRRHESLRTSFVEIEGEPRQRIHKRILFNLEKYQMQEAEAMDFIREQFIRPFDLSRLPLFRIGMITIDETRHILVFHLHHIIADGTSLGILLKELMQLYEGETLAPLPLRYIDYCRWQESTRQKQKTKKQEQYWLKQLEGDIPKLDLPIDFPRPPVRSFEGSSSQFHINTETTRKIKELASREDVTLHMFLLAVFNVFLFKITGQEDVLVGSPIANRLHADLQPLVGTFPNILVIRNYPRQDQTFGSFLKETRKQTLDAYANQEYQLEDLMGRVIKEKDPGRNSLFDVSFHLHNVETPVMETGNFRLTPIDIPLKASRYDLAFAALEQGAQIQVLVEYCTRLFKEKTIMMFIKSFQEVMASVLENKDVLLGDINISFKAVKPAGSDTRARPLSEAVEEYAPPIDEIEKKLVEIWSEVLFVPSVGIDANFFRLGGHSLKATLVTARIFKELNVNVPLAQVFKSPSIRGLAEYIRTAGEERFLPIHPAEQREYYPAAVAQKSIYIQHHKKKDSLVYNFSSLFLLKGEIIKEEIEDVFRVLIQRHDSFRTSFELRDGEPVQRVHKEVDFHLMYQESTEAAVEGIVNSFVKPFDLAKAPLLRVGLIKLDKARYLWIIDLHHTIYDGYSIGILVKEFLALYEGKIVLAPLSVHYRDFALWQNIPEVKETIHCQAEYWRKELSGDLPQLNLPIDYPRPQLQSFQGAVLKFEIDREKIKGLRETAAREGTTLFMVLLAAYYVLLSKLSGQEDIVVGIPAAGRRYADLQQVIGMFVNTLPMRNFPVNQKTFGEFLKEVKESLLQAFENQDYHYLQMVEQLSASMQRDPGRNPLFDVMFDFIGIEEDQPKDSCLKIPGRDIRVEPFKFEKKLAHFDLLLLAYEEQDKVSTVFEYVTALFKQETIENMVRYYKKLLDQVTGNINLEINELDLMSEQEKKLVLYDFNDTGEFYLEDKTLGQLFEEQAVKAPGSIAVIGQSAKRKAQGVDESRASCTMRHAITYRELNKKSGQLAHLLQEKGVKPDTIVGIKVESSIEMIIGIMGILKAGGAYLPIEPDCPAERMKYMLEDSCAEILLAAPGIQIKVEFKVKERPIELIELSDVFLPSTLTLTSSQVSSANLAYIIYTSGTTGKPKGVLTTHFNVTRVVRNTNYIEIKPEDRVLQLSNYAFDGSVFDIYGALLNGAALVLTGKPEAVDRLAALIKREQVTLFFVTTALFNTLVDLAIDCFAHVRKVLFGGERVSVAHTEKALEYMGKNRIIHVYGPTETTVYAAYYFIDNIDESAATIPIGSPLANTSVYILDRNFKPVPIGINGEIYIGGKGTARGYLNNLELTKKKFQITSPKLQTNYKLQNTNYKHKSYLSYMSYIYKTGDLGKWLPEGNIEFLGRIDQQVKLRGFRIELGEIENHLLEHDSIKEVVVVVRQDEGEDKYLCAYIVLKEGVKELTVKELQDYLRERLPGYMVPAYFIQLQSLPLTVNGKIHRKALPHPRKMIDQEEHYQAPRTETEKTIAAAWAEVLGLDPGKISIHHDFFQLGGNSISVLKTLDRLKKEFGCDISLSDMFVYSTVGELAANISRVILPPKTECIVRLNHARNKKNMFIFHPLHGMVYPYKELSRLLANTYNVYGIQARGLTDSFPMPLTFEEMRDDYLQQVRSVQTQGPYILAGYCIGNIFAYETARELEGNHSNVEKLILLDISSRFVDYYTRYLKVKESTVNVLDKLLLSSREKKNNTGQVLPGYEDVEKKKKQIENHIDNILKKHRYKRTIRAIKAPIWIIKTKDRKDPGLTEAYSSKMTEGKVVLKETPGNHETLLESPNVEKLAEILENI